MTTISYKMISVVTAVLVSLVLIAGCTAADERMQSQSASEARKKAAATVVKKPVATPAAKVKAKTTKPAKAKVVSAAKSDKVKPVPVVAPSKPTRVRSSIYLGSDGKMAGTGDPSKPASEAYKIGMSARPAALAGAGLPKDKFGLIDWVAVVNQGEIKPVGNLDPNKPEIPPFEMDVLIEAKGDFVNNILFPHKAHTYWLGCENCHPAIFVMGKGKNKMSMVDISEGKWCGRCHGKVAFPLTDCSRCHTQKKAELK